MRDTSTPTAVLLLSCPDRRGLVAAVAQFLSKQGGNIIHADQHTDREQGLFLQRIEWELKGFRLSRERFPTAFAPLAKHYGMRWRLNYSDQVQRLAVLVSREAHCLYDLLARQRMGEFSAEIPLVIGNHEVLRPVAERFGVPYLCFPHNAGQEASVAKALREARVDVVALARYMRILSPAFVKKFEGRLINIHHSFLPAFAGAKPYHQAHARGVKVIGATAHYVTRDLDAGPIIEQDIVRVSHRDGVNELIHKGRDLEKVVLARAVKLHLANRVMVCGNKTVVFD